MHRLLLALPLAVLLFAAPSHAAPAKVHAAAAHKAEKAGNWSKALEEWQAAYRMEANSDYLIGMGDAYAHLGDKANARKQYNAYLADPLSLDTDGVKAKLAALDKPASDDLSLDLGGPPAKAAVASNDLDLDLSGPPPADSKKKGKEKGKKGKKEASADLSLDLGGPSSLDLPPAAPAKSKVASNDLDLDLGPAPTTAKVTPPPTPPSSARGTQTKTVTASTMTSAPSGERTTTYSGSTASTPPAKVAVATNTRPPPQVGPVATVKAAPPESIGTGRAEPAVSSHSNRAVAFTTVGLAAVSLGFGGYFYAQASSNHSDLAAGGGTPSSSSALIQKESQNKSLALAGIIGGIALAGVATALFVF